MTTRFLRFPGGKSKALTFSYDDGVAPDKRLIDIFRANGMKGTFNINAACFGSEDGAPRIKGRMSVTETLEAYQEDVCEVACHAYSHPFLADCDTAVACGEILDDRRALEAIYKRPIHGMAYPYGSVNDDVVDICRLCGIWYNRTTVSTEKFTMPTDWLRLPATCHHNNKRLMELGDTFLQMKAVHAPQLFYVWGHSYEFDNDNNWDVIDAFCKKMAFHDDIWYATNMEIYLAWRDFQQLESSADGNMITNPTCRTVWFADKNNIAYSVAPGETIYMK